MRVAVLEPQPRLCGVTAYSFHLAQGFTDLGHTGHVVSFTKSGRTRRTGSARNGWYWWMEEPHVTKAIKDAGSVLDTYDLIVLNEPKNGTVDNDAKRQNELPWYIDALSATRTPWITVLHAPQYDEKRAPFLEPTMQAGNFTGIVLEHQAGSLESRADVFSRTVRTRQFWPWLPYRLRNDGSPSTERQAVIGIAGRFTANKGHITLGWHADQFPDGWSTRLHGAESGGLGACSSYLLYEGLARDHDWVGFRDGNPTRVATYRPDELNNWGDKIRAFPWWLQKNGHLLEYSGPYDDSYAVWQRCAIACNLTSSAFAVGLEYTMLEAMDAGCAIVMPAFAIANVPGGYQLHLLHEYQTTLTIGGKGQIRTDRFSETASQEIVRTVHAAAQAIADGGHDPAWNRNVVAQQHAPQHLANQIIQLIGGGT